MYKGDMVSTSIMFIPSLIAIHQLVWKLLQVVMDWHKHIMLKSYCSIYQEYAKNETKYSELF
jgi:hypothetical protein